jgi:hypothetical protein
MKKTLFKNKNNLKKIKNKKFTQRTFSVRVDEIFRNLFLKNLNIVIKKLYKFKICNQKIVINFLI